MTAFCLCLCLSEDYFPETNIEIERYLHFTDTHKGSSRRGSRNSSSASATSMRSIRSTHHRNSEQLFHTAPTPHIAVSNPTQLNSVNQQQHQQHQLMIHHNQRRRSSLQPSVLQHAAAVAAAGNLQHQIKVQQEQEHFNKVTHSPPPQNVIDQDPVIVEITEAK